MPPAVLDVDADGLARAHRKRILGNAGLRTIEAENCAEAVSVACAGGDVAAVLISSRVGDADGFATCRELKDDPRTAGIPVVILSLFSSSMDDYVRAVEAGADAWLSEPVDASVLIQTVRAVLTRLQRDIREFDNAESRDKHERFRAIVDQAGVGFVRATLEGQITATNRSFCDITGYSRAELLSMNYGDITHPEDIDINLEYNRRLFSRELRTFKIEKRYARKDGVTVWVSEFVTRVTQTGSPDFVFTVVEDISERKRIEQDLQRQLEFDRITSEVLRRFAACSGREVDEVIVDSLRAVAEYCSADHAFVLFRCPDGEPFRCAGEWCAPHVKPIVAPPNPVTAVDFPWNTSTLADQELVLHDIDDLPAEADAERAWLERHGAVAVLRIPLDPGAAREEGVNRWIAVLRHADRQGWSSTDLTRVRMMGNAIAAVMERKRAEELLHQSERKFNLVFHAIPEPTVVTSIADEKIIDVNFRFSQVSGYARDEAIGKSSEELGLFLYAPDRKTTWSELLKKGWFCDSEIIFRTKSGALRTGLLSAVTVEVLGQRYLVSTVRDITQRRQAEEALRHQAAFDDLLNNLLSEFVRCDIAELSIAIEKALGAIASFFVADHLMVFEVLPETTNWRIAREWCAPDVTPIASVQGHDRLWYKDEALSDNDVVINIGNHDTEGGYDMVTADGATVVLNVPIKGVGGVITGRIGLHRHGGRIPWTKEDASRLRTAGNAIGGAMERVRAEEAVRANEEYFRMLADAAPIAIWMSGPDKAGIFFNRWATRFAGRTVEELSGTGWMEILHPDDRQRYIATCFTSADSRRPFSAEARMRRTDGEYRWCLVSGIPRVVDGVYQGHVGTSLDITNLKRAYEQRLTAQKLESLGIMATRVAHDFNNLLGVIVARADSALSDMEPGAPAAEDLEQIRETACRARDIASQIMTFSGNENAPVTALDLSGLIAQMVDVLEVSISKTAILRTDLASNLPNIDANPAEIQQVIMNLVINASEALEGKPGNISITTAIGRFRADSGATVHLEVGDTGCGMTDAVKAHIFDPFFTTRFAKQGLGLSAVQGIVRRHGGSIEVESTLGKGSRFAVLFPSGAPSKLDLPVPSAQRVAAKGGVLLIEDENSFRSVIAKLLRKRGFQVIEAADGETAVQRMKSDPASIDVVVLDLTLPGACGMEIFDELRRIRPDAKVILSTAYQRGTIASQFGERDFRGFIRKPYQIDELEELLLQVSGL
jgi:PAS domain S-box-containing protein